MMNRILKSLLIIFFIIIVLIICILSIVLVFRIDSSINQANLNNWLSAFLSLTAILVGVFIIINFTTILTAFNVSKEGSDKARKLPELIEILNNHESRISIMEKQKLRLEMEKYLHDLKSKDVNDRYTAILGLSEIGSEICLEALHNAIKNKNETPRIREIIQYAIGRIESRKD